MATLYQQINKYNKENKTALYFENKKISYKELNINVRKMAYYLKEKGISKGDVVTLVLPNVPLTIYLIYALDLIGAIQDIVHPLMPLASVLEGMKETSSKYCVMLETAYMENSEVFKNSGYTFFFVNPCYDNSFFMKHCFYLKYKKAPEQKNIFHIDNFRKCKEITDYKIRDEKENCIYLHSGGTTGKSKIIALSDFAFSELASKINYIVGGRNLINKSMLAVLPCFHGFGLGMGVVAPLSVGASSSLMMKFNSKKVIKWINENKVNYIIGIPLLYKKLFSQKKFLKSKLNNLEYCFVGGDNVDHKFIEEFNTIMKENNCDCMMLEGYGLTETVTVSHVNTKENNKIGSVGKPLEGINQLIVDENNNILPCDEIGEVLISSKTMMNEYLNDDKLTNEVIVTLDNRKWIRSGDLGYIDKDGFLFLKGRKKRLIKISGINVFPAEIENFVCKNNKVYSSALVYFENPIPHTILYIIKDKNYNGEEKELIDELMREIKENFIKYAVPHKIVVIDKFPVTKIGKIDYSSFIDEY